MSELLHFLDHPPWYLAIIMLVVGLYGLSRGGDLLVAGSVTLARRLGLAPAVIGATIVAFGTSTPELVVSVSAAWEARASADVHGVIDPDGPAAIAVANVIGSNIFNVLLILGITLVLAPITVPATSRRIDLPFLVLATGACIAFAFIGEPAALQRWEAALLVAGAVIFLVTSLRLGAVDASEVNAVDAKASAWPAIIGGLVCLLVGGRICLSGAVGLAEAAGMSQRLIGLTVVAAGTSLPEFFASIQAARKGHADIALTNILGSNILNIFAILGLAGLLVPLPVNQGSLTCDLWWMLGAAVVLIPALVRGHMGRTLGVVLLVGYAASMTMAIMA